MSEAVAAIPTISHDEKKQSEELAALEGHDADIHTDGQTIQTNKDDTLTNSHKTENGTLEPNGSPSPAQP